MVLQLLNFNSETAKEGTFLAYSIKKVKSMFDGGITSILFSFDKFPLKSLVLKHVGLSPAMSSILSEV